MSKGKAHKPYEFGAKASITTTRASKIIVGALAFNENKYDSHTLPDVLLQIKCLHRHEPETALCDRGYKGKNKINNTTIRRPTKNTAPKNIRKNSANVSVTVPALNR